MFTDFIYTYKLPPIVKNIFLNIALIFFLNISVAQTKSIFEMSQEMSKPQIEKTDLNNYVSKNLSNKNQIAEFFYYWISLNIEYDYGLLKKIRSNKLSEYERNQSSDTDFIFKEKKPFV